MPDGRFLSKSVAHDLELNTVSLEADYLFSRCVPHLDVEGRMAGHPTQVKAIAAPLRTELTVGVIERALHELNDAGLVIWYEADSRLFLAFPGFTRNQKGLRKKREAPSGLPSPKGKAAQRVTESVRSRSGVGPAEVRPSEVKLSQAKLSSVSNETGASPAVENSENEQSDELRGEFAQLVRRHLWQSKDPPAKDWTMGREFTIRDRLIAQGESPEIINGVVARYRGDPATMKVYWAKDSRPRWEIDKNECLKSQPARVPKGLPTVGEVLSELGGAA